MMITLINYVLLAIIAVSVVLEDSLTNATHAKSIETIQIIYALVLMECIKVAKYAIIVEYNAKHVQ